MKRAAGFTLMEMIVGLVLLGLMSIALFSAMRLGVQSWERAETKSQRVVDLRIVEGVLRREVGKAYPLRVGLANENKIAFEGDSRGLRFLSTLPAHFTTGGLSWISLETVNSSDTENRDSRNLVLRYAVLDGPAQDFSALDKATDQTVLLRDLESVEFDFFGQESETAEPTWRRDWAASARLPNLVKLNLKFRSGSEPRILYIPIRLGEEAGCFHTSFQRQCGPRK
jgi:general secretion pathway protein J